MNTLPPDPDVHLPRAGEGPRAGAWAAAAVLVIAVVLASGAVG
ncbi:MAG: hypothetical protein V4792_16885 [Pseudomonadota bacterium]